MNRLGNSKTEDEYWSALKTVSAASSIIKRMTAVEGWEYLRDENGANPLLVALHSCPGVLVAKGLPKTALGLLGEVDEAGQDLWFYLLSSPRWGVGSSTSDPKLRKRIAKLLHNYPPQLSKSGQGWWSHLSLPAVQLIDIANNGGLLLQTMDAQPELQRVLRPGAVEQQQILVKKLLDEACERPWIRRADGTILLSNLLRLMLPDTLAKVIPELRFLGVIGAALDAGDPPPSMGILNAQHRLAIPRLQSLAAQGLNFGGVSTNDEGGEPWTGRHPVPQWVAVCTVLHHHFPQAISSLELGWRDSILKGIGSSHSESVECETPRL